MKQIEFYQNKRAWRICFIKIVIKLTKIIKEIKTLIRLLLANAVNTSFSSVHILLHIS